ncbi:hypothetical protein M378DRAFT_14395 [Amanita muscaria Koide BX008]|uniref:Uncharacterized protein n=1 Tax=Amanita muscaria (strain Koide BX008) TaxID=946122 RepID=A0A0C2SBB9_AMAMK|nr:hypothetical protein M378DRAFT_14395 [Amanita muscaria Koide BX008]
MSIHHPSIVTPTCLRTLEGGEVREDADMNDASTALLLTLHQTLLICSILSARSAPPMLQRSSGKR